MDIHLPICPEPGITVLPNKSNINPIISPYQKPMSNKASRGFPSLMRMCAFTAIPVNKWIIPKTNDTIKSVIGCSMGFSHKGFTVKSELNNSLAAAGMASPNQLPNITPQNAVDIPQ
ncbi:hypothetical protein SDC9_63337 [bioreactor metagenome]|uniref:Uncharacterized protein n=1 Tax=bioreactor metagenome TaxID=1076179 RepID=A0A644XL96_9ZZZZ